MSKISGKVIGSLFGGALTIGGITTLSQINRQTDEINKQIDSAITIIKKVDQDIDCYQDGMCILAFGTPDEYNQKLVEFKSEADIFDRSVDGFNSTCAGKREKDIPETDKQKCIDLSNNIAGQIDAITETAEDLDGRIQSFQEYFLQDTQK